ncbi:MAG: PLP-dependent transferase, partial [Thermoleophilia bacterium]|nr:PLP-dependent transferase [Thermoleophilia bacterium]
IARRQMDDFSGMISFELAGSREDAFELLRSTEIWLLGESLGGVESLIEHPGLMTHASTADSAFPVPENLIRLSVGIESADDLVADLEQALSKVAAASPAR